MIGPPNSYPPPSRLRGLRTARILLPLMAAATAFALAIGGVPALVGGALLIALLAAAVAAAVRPALVLVFFVVALPFHLLMMVLLFNAGLDHTLLRLFSVWKEATTAVVLAVLVARQLAGGKMPRVRVLDGIVLAFLAWNLLYLVAPIGSPFRPAMITRVQGLRDNVFFVFVYFIGRLAPMTVRDVRLALSSAIAIGVLGVLVGFAERFLLPIDFFFDPLHLDDFMRQYLNLLYYTGLPFNFWTSVGKVRRAVSFYLGSHHFAASFLLLLPLILGLRRPLRPFPSRARLPLLVLAAVGLVLPLTRSVVLACVLQILLLGIVSRRPQWVVTASAGVLLLLGSSLVFLDMGSYLTRVTQAAPGSSVYTHAQAWTNTAEILRDYPMGVGFGVVDTAAERADPSRSYNLEGEYAFTVSTVGVVGLAIFVVLQLSVAATLLHRWSHAPGTAMRNLAVVTFAMLAGYAVVAGFTQVRHVPSLMYPLWWLVGTVVRGGLGDDG